MNKNKIARCKQTSTKVTHFLFKWRIRRVAVNTMNYLDSLDLSSNLWILCMFHMLLATDIQLAVIGYVGSDDKLRDVIKYRGHHGYSYLLYIAL